MIQAAICCRIRLYDRPWKGFDWRVPVLGSMCKGRPLLGSEIVITLGGWEMLSHVSLGNVELGRSRRPPTRCSCNVIVKIRTVISSEKAAQERLTKVDPSKVAAAVEP